MNHSILQSTGIFSLDFSERRAQCHFFSFFFISERKMSENTSFPTINRQRSGKKVLSIRVQNFGERERERAARSLARLKIKEEQLALARSRKNLDPFSSLARARSRTFFKASARELVQLASQFRKLAS